VAVLDAEVQRRALAAVEALGREAPVRAAYVFGSHVDGRADEWSDIDLAAFVEGAESWDLWRRTQAIVRIQKEVGYDVEPHLFSAAQLDNAEPGSFAADVLKRGIRIV
jgi:predicted nucleotidyltransferase